VGALLSVRGAVRWGGLGLVFLVIAIWIESYFARWDLIPVVGLVGMTGLAVAGLYSGLDATLCAAASVLALVGWDLDLFARRLRDFPRIEGEVVGNHLKSTALVAALGIGLVLLGLHVRLTLSFGPALLLAVAMIASLVGILRMGRGRSFRSL